LPRNLEYLRRHIAINGITNVEIIAAAVGERSGVARFAEGTSTATGQLAPGGSLAVPVVSLDDLYSQGRIRLPDCMKIDVEGGEVGVLRGAARILAEARPAILLATHSPELHRACVDLLLASGYRVDPIGSMPAMDELVAHR
jgi:FkbM family methyltransferase